MIDNKRKEEIKGREAIYQKVITLLQYEVEITAKDAWGILKEEWSRILPIRETIDWLYEPEIKGHKSSFYVSLAIVNGKEEIVKEFHGIDTAHQYDNKAFKGAMEYLESIRGYLYSHKDVVEQVKKLARQRMGAQLRARQLKLGIVEEKYIGVLTDKEILEAHLACNKCEVSLFDSEDEVDMILLKVQSAEELIQEIDQALARHKHYN